MSVVELLTACYLALLVGILIAAAWYLCRLLRAHLSARRTERRWLTSPSRRDDR